MKCRVKNNLACILEQISGTIVMFLYITDILFIGVPTVLSARKLVFAVFVFYAVFRLKKIEIRNYQKIYYLLACTAILAYTCLILMLNGNAGHENSILSRIFFFLMYAVAGSTLVRECVRDEYRFYQYYMNALIIEAAVVYLNFFLVPFRNLMKTCIYNGGHVGFERTDRVASIGFEAGALTFLLFTGVFICDYMIVTKGLKAKYIAVQMYLAGAMFFAGRTGIYFTIFMTVCTMIILAGRKRRLKDLLGYVLGLGLILIAVLYVFRQIVSPERFNRLFYRIVNLFFHSSADMTLAQLRSMQIPPFCLEMLAGTGIYRGTAAGGLSVQHDSGYVQAYFAMGLPAAAVFYICLLAYLLALCSRREMKKTAERTMFLVYIFISFAAELKEPFLFKYITVFFIITAAELHCKKIRRENGARLWQSAGQKKPSV